MRLLYLPLYTHTDVSKCSTFLSMGKMFKLLIERHDNIFIYFPVPKESYPISLLQHSRILQIPIEVRYKQRDEMRTYDRVLVELFNEISGKYFVDIIISDKQMVINNFMGEIKSYVEAGSGDMGLVNIVSFIVDLKSSDALSSMARYENLSGLLFSDVNLFSLKNDINRVIAEARKYISPSMLNEFIDKSKIDFGWFDNEEIDKHISADKYDVFSVNWGYGLTKAYNIYDAYDVVDRLFCTGVEFNFVMCSSGDVSTVIQSKFNRDHPAIRLYERCSQHDFWDIASRCHCFLYLTKISELCMSVLEQQYMGQVGIFSRGGHNEGWLYDGYPYIANDINEVVLYLKHIKENYNSDEVQGVIKKQKKYIEKYFLSDWVDRFYGRLEMLYADVMDRNSGRGECRKSMLSQFNIPDIVSWNQLKEIIKNESINKLDVDTRIGRYASSKAIYRRSILRSGYYDDCSSENSIFRRKDSGKI